MNQCVSHHHACDCREEKIARLLSIARHIHEFAFRVTDCMGDDYPAMESDEYEALGKALAAFDGELDCASPALLSRVRELEAQLAALRGRKRYQCKHWDNSTPPEEFCTLFCRSCNGPCAAWEPGSPGKEY